MIERLIIFLLLCALTASTNETPRKQHPLSDMERVWYCENNPDCKLLSIVGYFEARNQKSDAAVAGPMFVVLNRRDHPKLWGSSLHSVVYAPWQFSYVHDGSLKRGITDQKAYRRMLKIAHYVWSGEIEDPTGKADHYHTTKVSPVWKHKLKKTVKLGSHIYYRKD